MKIKVKEFITTDKEVGIELPYFSKTNAHMFMLFGEGERDVITVMHGGDFAAPEIKTGYLSFAMDKANEPCTRDEFMEAFTKVNQILIAKVSMPTQDERNDAQIAASENFERTEIFA